MLLQQLQHQHGNCFDPARAPVAAQWTRPDISLLALQRPPPADTCSADPEPGPGLLLSVREREWIEVLRQRFPEGMPSREQVVVRCA